MAVYTKTTLIELKKHFENYEIDELVDFVEIIDGIDNSNFIINTTANKYIFTIFENRIDKNSLPYFIDFKEHLFAKNISCPHPIIAKNGQKILDFNGKKTVLVSFLNGSTLKTKDDGYYYSITNHHCFLIGEILAKMHLAAMDFSSNRINDLGIDGFGKIYEKIKNFLPQHDPALEKLITHSINIVNNKWQKNLPKASCHLDLFPDNIFFENNQLSGVIDFYFSATDLLIYDFAIAVNAWCFDKVQFNPEKFENLLRGYQKFRQFNATEINFLQSALIAGALRFLLTRLHDYFFTAKDSLVKIKNPEEYKSKLVFFLNNVIHN